MQSVLGAGAQEDFAEHMDTTTRHKSLKRKHEESAIEVGTENTVESGFHSKKQCAVQSDEQGRYQDHDLNFPLPDEKGLPCIVKVCCAAATWLAG